jgi:spore coat protein U-like protein
MIRRSILLVIAGMLASLFLAPSPARAACSPLSLCSCTVTATAVSFGTYDPLSSAADDSTGTVRVRCTLVVALAGSFTVSLSTGGSGNYAARNLHNGASNLLYNLYTNTTRAQVWGNGTGGSVSVSQTFSGLLAIDRSLTIYGRIPAGQNVPAGTYSDTILVTVTY